MKMYEPTKAQLTKMWFVFTALPPITFYFKKIDRSFSGYDIRGIYYSDTYKKWDLWPFQIYPKSKKEIDILISLFSEI